MSQIPEHLVQARAKWRYRGVERPGFAATPEPGQESVWDYPRPPVNQAVSQEVLVSFGEVVVARTSGARRVLETASPPNFYIPPGDVRTGLFEARRGRSWCEWKGEARYWTLRADPALGGVAWSYDDPFPGFEEIAGFWSFYPGCLDCRIDGVPAAPQPGGLYGGWVTPGLAGPFKGAPGTEDW